MGNKFGRRWTLSITTNPRGFSPMHPEYFVVVRFEQSCK
jgi:hypothetical protein